MLQHSVEVSRNNTRSLSSLNIGSRRSPRSARDFRRSSSKQRVRRAGFDLFLAQGEPTGTRKRRSRLRPRLLKVLGWVVDYAACLRLRRLRTAENPNGSNSNAPATIVVGSGTAVVVKLAAEK